MKDRAGRIAIGVTLFIAAAFAAIAISEQTSSPPAQTEPLDATRPAVASSNDTAADSMSQDSALTPAAMTLTPAIALPPSLSPQTSAQEQNAASANDTFQYQINGVPAGFEAWFEPQKIAVDVFYGGRYLLTTLAEYTAEEIALLNPQELASRIPGLLDVNAMTDFLGKPLPNNADRLCKTINQPLCGRIDPEYAGLIFDESRFRADFFVNGELLDAAPQADPRYLPDGDGKRPTAVQNLHTLYSADDQGNERYSIFGRTRAGRNGHYIFSDWVSTDSQNLSVDELGYRHDLRDHIVTLGIFQSSTDMLRGMSRDLLLGGSVFRSMMRRTDLTSMIATPVEIFLPLRSRVEIFQDERLVFSGFYEAGNQRIDTSRLPAGAYLINVVVTDANGNISTEQQLFVKSTLLAPPGEPIWFAEAGKVMRRSPFETMPDELDVSLLRAGIRWRQNSWLGLGAAGAATEESGLGELSTNILLDRVEAGADVYASTEGGWGAGLRGVTRFGKNYFSLSSRYNRADPLPPADETQYRLIDNDRWIHSLQLTSRPSAQGSVSALASYTGGDGLPSSRRTSLRYNHYLPLDSNHSVTLTAEVGEVDGDGRILFGAQWRNNRTHWSHSARTEWRDSQVTGEADGFSANVATRWRDQDLFTSDLNAGASAQIDSDGRGLTADVQHGSEYGRGQLAVSHDQRSNFNQTQYLASYDTSIVVGESWRPAAGGGPQNNESAIILDLRDAKGGSVDVYANGQRQFTARGGRRIPVSLAPYAEYRISLIDRGTALLNLDQTPRQLVLYPGDVTTLQWSLSRVNIIVGKLSRLQEFCSEVTGECHTLRLPLQDTRIVGLEGFVLTDTDGFFQGEVLEGISQLKAAIQGVECVLDISTLPVNDGVIRAPGLICAPERHDGNIIPSRPE